LQLASSFRRHYGGDTNCVILIILTVPLYRPSILITSCFKRHCIDVASNQRMGLMKLISNNCYCRSFCVTLEAEGAVVCCGFAAVHVYDVFVVSTVDTSPAVTDKRVDSMSGGSTEKAEPSLITIKYSTAQLPCIHCEVMKLACCALSIHTMRRATLSMQRW